MVGSADPGLAWHLDLAQVETDVAPEGYDDLDTQEVLWEVPNVSPRSQGDCQPAIGSQDRIWVEHRPDAGDRIVAAFDPETGERTSAQIEAEGQQCFRRIIIGGEQERLIFANRNASNLRMFDINGIDPIEIEVPTKDDIDSTECDRAYMLADDDRVYLSTRRTGDSQILALDVAGGDLSLDWDVDLDLRAPDLTLGDGVVLFQDDRRVAGAAPSVTALDAAEG